MSEEYQIKPGCLLTIQLMGSMAVRINDIPMQPLRSRKGMWLLALLALRANQEVSRDWLAGMLWPDSMEAVATLRRTLTDLRRVLDQAAPLLIAPTSRTLKLCLPASQVDVLEFDAAAKRTDLASLETAVGLYRGALLAECSEIWIEPEREVRRESYLGVLERAAELCQAQDAGKAVHYLRTAIAADPYRESLYRRLMEVHANQREAAAAILVYRDLRLRMRSELNSAPATETDELYRRIRAASPRKASPPEAASDATTRSETSPKERPTAPEPPLIRLPRPLTQLIGREAELEAIAASLLQGRLITLTGIGGIGKTRLAIEAARENQASFADGVVFVSLATLSDPERIPQGIAVALDQHEDPDRSPMEALIHRIGDRELLLVLDNCEHLVEACARTVGALLSGCPRLQILATSRQSLGLNGELLLPIPPLVLPADTAALSLEEEGLLSLMRYPAMQLFVERAQACHPSFTITRHNLPAIAQICTHLDGIPLALELAATRVKVLTVEQIRSRITERFRLLSQGDRTALPHHRTLRGMLDWSYDLISAPERVLLYRLAIFAGGWSLEAAEAVCADFERSAPPEADENRTLLDPPISMVPPVQNSQVAIQNSDVLDLLTQLVEASLVSVGEEAGGERRYHLLQIVHEYATEKLDCSGERGDVARRHRDYLIQLVKQAYAHNHGPEQQRCLALLEREYDNIRAALNFCMQESDGGEPGLALAGHLQIFWWIRGLLREGAAWLRTALRHPGAQQCDQMRAFALNGLGVLIWMQGDAVEAACLFQSSLEGYRELGNRRMAAVVLGNLGSLFRDRGDYERSRDCLEQSLAVFREMNLTWNSATALTNLGSAAVHQGELDYARRCYEEALELRRQLQDRRGMAVSLCGLGMVYAGQEAWPQALNYYEEALALQREFNEKTNLTVTLLNMGQLQSRRGDLPQAGRLLREALDICCETGDSLTTEALYELSLICQKASVYDHALSLCAASSAQAQQRDAPLPKELPGLQEELRRRLGEEAAIAAWSIGWNLSLEKAGALFDEVALR